MAVAGLAPMEGHTMPLAQGREGRPEGDPGAYGVSESEGARGRQACLGACTAVLTCLRMQISQGGGRPFPV